MGVTYVFLSYRAHNLHKQTDRWTVFPIFPFCSTAGDNKHVFKVFNKSLLIVLHVGATFYKANLYCHGGLQRDLKTVVKCVKLWNQLLGSWLCLDQISALSACVKKKKKRHGRGNVTTWRRVAEARDVTGTEREIKKKGARTGDQPEPERFTELTVLASSVSMTTRLFIRSHDGEAALHARLKQPIVWNDCVCGSTADESTLGFKSFTDAPLIKHSIMKQGEHPPPPTMHTHTVTSTLDKWHYTHRVTNYTRRAAGLGGCQSNSYTDTHNVWWTYSTTKTTLHVARKLILLLCLWWHSELL